MPSNTNITRVIRNDWYMCDAIFGMARLNYISKFAGCWFGKITMLQLIFGFSCGLSVNRFDWLGDYSKFYGWTV